MLALYHVHKLTGSQGACSSLWASLVGQKKWTLLWNLRTEYLCTAATLIVETHSQYLSMSMLIKWLSTILISLFIFSSNRTYCIFHPWFTISKYFLQCILTCLYSILCCLCWYLHTCHTCIQIGFGVFGWMVGAQPSLGRGYQHQALPRRSSAHPHTPWH